MDDLDAYGLIKKRKYLTDRINTGLAGFQDKGLDRGLYGEILGMMFDLGVLLKEYEENVRLLKDLAWLAWSFSTTWYGLGLENCLKVWRDLQNDIERHEELMVAKEGEDDFYAGD